MKRVITTTQIQRQIWALILTRATARSRLQGSDAIILQVKIIGAYNSALYCHHKIASIEGNKRNFMKRDAAWEEEACCFQHVAGYLSNATLARANNDEIKNLLIVLQDVKLMNSILDKSPYVMKNKTIRGQPDAVETKAIPLPKSLLNINKIWCYALMWRLLTMLFPEMNMSKTFNIISKL